MFKNVKNRFIVYWIFSIYSTLLNIKIISWVFNNPEKSRPYWEHIVILIIIIYYTTIVLPFTFSISILGNNIKTFSDEFMLIIFVSFFGVTFQIFTIYCLIYILFRYIKVKKLEMKECGF